MPKHKPKVHPTSWYILDLRNPKKPLVAATRFMFKEQAEATIRRTFPNNELIQPVIGQELIDFNILPKYQAYKSYRFSIKKYFFPEGLTDREKKTLRKAYRRLRRRLKYMEVNNLPPKPRFQWGDSLPKNLYIDGVFYKNPERYRVRGEKLRQLYRTTDHL